MTAHMKNFLLETMYVIRDVLAGLLITVMIIGFIAMYSLADVQW